MSAANPADQQPMIVFAGGGTGGHIFPALAIAEAVAERAPAARFVYFCSDRPLDAQILDEAGVEHHVLKAKPFIMRPRGLVRFLSSWGPSVRTSRSVLRDAKRAGPTKLVAMGGFVSPPAVIAARAEGVPVTLVNLDATPGRANRFVAKRAHTTVTALPVTGRDWATVGPIVRRELSLRARSVSDGLTQSARTSFGLDPNLKTLLITGGSQGAQTVGRFAIAAARLHPYALNGWQVIHQAGVHDTDDDFAKDWNDLGVRAHIEPFIADMASAWAASDLHLGRCGAGTVSECWATRTPSFFLPYPWHKDQHQRANAAVLVEAGAAEVVHDWIDPIANAGEHAAALVELLTSDARRAHMVGGFDALGTPDGAAHIATMLVG